MKEVEKKISDIVRLMGFGEHRIESFPENRLISVIIYDGFITSERLPKIVSHMNQVVRLIAKKEGVGPVIVDVNNYRKERERLIVELAKAAARRALASKQIVELPPMNAYERRLVHAELSMRPDVATESKGEGKKRRVMVRVID